MMKYVFNSINGMWKTVFVMCICVAVYGIVPSFAADYTASVPCPPEDIVLNPNESIIRTKGQVDTKEFEIVAGNPDVRIVVKKWEINGEEVGGTSISNWGQFELSSDKKTMRWTLGEDAEGDFTLSAIIRRGCGNGGTAKDEEISWSGSVISVIIKRDGNDITEPQDNPQEVKVGEMINLTAEVQNTPANSNITYRWTIPGTVAHDWTHDTQGSLRWPLGDAQKKQQSINFAWIDGGDGRQVIVVVAMDGRVIASAVAMFDVYRPEYGLYITQTGDVRFAQYDSEGDFVLQDGDTDGIPGVTMFMTGVPAGEAANCNFWQIVTQSIRKRKTVSGWTHMRNTGGEFTLDTSDPYGKDFLLAPNGTGTSDSPGVGVLPTDTELSIEDNFSHFLMYKPPGAEHTASIWVPLSTANWNWAGHAIKQGSNWASIDLISHTLPLSTAGTSTTSYPGGLGWTNNIYPPVWDKGEQ